MDSLKASVLTAFYTPQAITDTIADVLHDRKVRPRLVLEPSAGMGAFISPVLSNNPQAEVMAFEKDLLTGKMLGHLYPQQKIRTEGFEKIEKPFLNHFDLAISISLSGISECLMQSSAAAHPSADVRHRKPSMTIFSERSGCGA